MSLRTVHQQSCVIKTSNNGQCTFPDGGAFTLRAFGSNKCCDYTCTFGSCGSGTTARCLQSNEVCQSGVPVVRSAKRDIHGTRCPQGLTSCAVAQNGKRQLYECMDTRSDLESCGGCLYPDLRYGNSTASGGFGRDCTAIPNVAEVSCEASRCKIYACDPGYELVNDECVPSASGLFQLKQYRL
ncbi:hypothetical protein NliqN6_3922 [Naganishia liquefaciens]|uniref:Protein CPL1-like domain-containing protein n=1 Tax=Naganishia liquefaciens TaxID=104408 RepID=A0A8H3YFB0_9TREE|nr:hypothetical protein NliqN6_3922 [Naganishia liquefaciens]